MGSGGGGRSAIGTKGGARGVSETSLSAIEVIRTKGKNRGISETTVSATEGKKAKGVHGGSTVSKKSKELTVSIANPRDKKTVSGQIEVIVEVRGGQGKIRGSVLLNGAPIGKIERRGALRIPYDTIRKINGTYELKAMAKDNKKGEDTDTLQIIINNRVH